MTESIDNTPQSENTVDAKSERYNPAAIEPKWQQRWAESRLYETSQQPPRGDKKFYYLDMFPYPSGDLHVGHVRNYAIGDAVARYHVMNGADVLHPMGWDAFGLPAENAAIKNHTHPAEWTELCIGKMKDQFARLGISFDWNRELATCKPDYYHWTQWIFLQFFKKGLAERRQANVNWCPTDQTVLANEQVKDGMCERCGTVVEQKALTQWFFKTSEYAPRLLDDLDKLGDWPARVVSMQRNWIGRSEGVTFRFPLRDIEGEIEVFTTRVDTVFGVTYMVIAPDHALVSKLVTEENKAAADAFKIRAAAQQDAQRDRGEEIPKEGVFTGSYCTNPMNGEAVPIWLANYVVSDYGSGAVMAVPAHDERDWDFAKKYDLPIKVVIAAPGADECDIQQPQAAMTEAGILVHSALFSGVENDEAKTRIAQWMEEKSIGARSTNYRLRDWCLSRQRYWGCPIPVIYKEDGTVEAVPEDQLPVLLPTDVEFTGKGGNPLLQAEDWINTVDSEGRPARRETDTMDTFIDSSWYFLRFCSPDAGDVPFRKEDVEKWMPVDQYVGGVEHATGHLIFARFVTKVLYDMGISPVDEPFHKYFAQGMVTQYSPVKGKVAKMSKSSGYSVSLDDAVARHGTDATRLVTLFLGPPEMDVEWTEQSDSTFAGTARFLERVWRVCQAQPFDANWKNADFSSGLSEADVKLRRKTHQTILKVQSDVERIALNTCVSALMEHLNTLQEWLNANKDGGNAAVYSEAVESMVLCLGPFAPHLSDELLERLGFAETSFRMSWPVADESVAKEDEITLPVQVNGKLRARLVVAADASEDDLRAAALAAPEIVAILEGREPKKVIVVPGRLVNVVG